MLNTAVFGAIGQFPLTAVLKKNMNCKLKLHSKGNTDKFGGTLLCLNFP